VRVEEFDAIVIGTGQAGPSLAGRLAGAGQRVAIIERKLVGGTCVNTGCTPTKAMVASAYAAHLARRAGEYGVTIEGRIGLDFRTVQARKDAISAASREGLETWLEGMANCTLIRGHARFESARTVRVAERVLTAPRIFLNVGGRAVVPDMPGVGSVPHLTNTSILALEAVPRHLVVVGGSYIGLEFAQIFRRFGAAVTVVERAPHLVSHEDEDVSVAVQEILEAEGIAVRTNATCITIAPHAEGVAVGLDCASDAKEVVGSHLLLAMGRRPNTDDLGLDRAGVATDGRGFVTVDDGLRTNVDGIWALGDCNGRGAFTHTSYNDYEIVAQNLLDGASRRVSDRIPAYALYIDPPLGRVGMSVAEARRAGKRVLVGKRPMTRVARAVEKGETQGFMKVVVAADTHEILGAAILGVGGDEVVQDILDVMTAKLPYTAISRTMHIHPTVSELVPTLLQELTPLQ
jgi:pyruvate/2-oxoglutarate dehydrogenase complex dihydrolipoamide dehydrogenase (E3) component